MADEQCCNGQCKSVSEQQETVESNENLENAGHASVFLIPKMDCPSEEQLIRTALSDVNPPVSLKFDIPNRSLRIYHEDNLSEIENRITQLGLGATLQQTNPVDAMSLSEARESELYSKKSEAKILKWLLAINATMFGIEMVAGWLAQSSGLIADSLDMFADAAVYGLALYAVGHSQRMKLRAAHLSGWLQILLALSVLFEVIHRFIFGSDPLSTLMMIFGFVALLANVTCLFLISQQKNNGAHMKASWIFSANDVIANIGVIVAGALVAWTGSRYPDLVIGLIIAVIVLNGARRILQLKH